MQEAHNQADEPDGKKDAVYVNALQARKVFGPLVIRKR
jgi:hypothetical protein